MSHKGIMLLTDIAEGIDTDIESIELTMNDSDGELMSDEDIQVLTSIQEMLKILKSHVNGAVIELRR